MKTKQLKPVEIKRSEFGEWIHPQVGKYWDEMFGSDIEHIGGEEWKELKRYFNIQTVTLHLESSVSDDDYEEIIDGCDLSKWDPIAPNGFFLMSINFTEDGADAVFAREIRKECEVV